MPPRTLHRLGNARKVDATRGSGRYADGGGLYLVVTPTGTRNWMFRYRERGAGGKRHELGLGGYPDVTLAVARDKAARHRAMIESGNDPYAEKRNARAANSRKIPTFEQVLDMLIASRQAAWKNAKHKNQWRNSVVQHAGKLLDLDVGRVETSHVLEVLEPIWGVIPETASRVRNRIENTLDYARSKGFRTGENPARWRGHLQHVLTKRSKLTRGHFESMPYAEVPAFYQGLQMVPSMSARALEVLILCVSRTSEVTEIPWTEVQLQIATWAIPGKRMKGGLEHRVPLPPRAVKILRQLEKVKVGPFVFPAQRNPESPLSNMALEALLRRMGVKPYTVHGFRSSFRTWAGEKTNYPREVIEACLAHKIGENPVEGAYLKTTYFDKRRRLLEEWANFLATDKGSVGDL